MNNIGKVIKDSFCNGFFNGSHNYDLNGAVVMAEGEDWMVVRKINGKPDYATEFTQKHVDDWCKEKEEL